MSGFYLTSRVYKVIFQKPILAHIRQLILILTNIKNKLTNSWRNRNLQNDLINTFCELSCLCQKRSVRFPFNTGGDPHRLALRKGEGGGSTFQLRGGVGQPRLVCAPGEAYRGTSLIRNSVPLGPYSRKLPRAFWRPSGGELFLLSEVHLSSPSIQPQKVPRHFPW